MKYLQPKFSVAMPGGKRWPFKRDRMGEVARFGAYCARCLAPLTYADTHFHHDDRNKVRKRICFGGKGA